MPYKKVASEVLEIAKQAGDIIMKYYEGQIKVEIKEDESPVTPADLAANKFIQEKLNELDVDIPIVSEEKY